MQCREISGRQFELVLGELTGVSREGGAVEAFRGRHRLFGATVLVRDGSRCMALVHDPTCLDRLLAEHAFLEDGTAGAVAGRG